MSELEYHCTTCQEALRKHLRVDRAAILKCPRCGRVAAIAWLEDDIPVIANQMSLSDYPEVME